MASAKSGQDTFMNRAKGRGSSHGGRPLRVSADRDVSLYARIRIDAC